jgi:16S rRNA (uracil1498-N3)-methyltransferase
MDKKRGMLECIECLLPSVPTASGTDLGPFPHLLFPLLKSARLTYLLEKSVELGVGALYPIITEHTMVASFNTERWQVVIKQATEQCGRLLMPLVHAPKKLESALAAWPREISLFVGDERPAAPPIAPFLKKMPSKTAFLVGPEGGFSVREFATFDRLSFITCVSLGSTVLRTETATSALLALYAAFH